MITELGAEMEAQQVTAYPVTFTYTGNAAGLASPTHTHVCTTTALSLYTTPRHSPHHPVTPAYPKANCYSIKLRLNQEMWLIRPKLIDSSSPTPCLPVLRLQVTRRWSMPLPLLPCPWRRLLHCTTCIASPRSSSWRNCVKYLCLVLLPPGLTLFLSHCLVLTLVLFVLFHDFLNFIVFSCNFMLYVLFVSNFCYLFVFPNLIYLSAMTVVKNSS